ncbi:MAG: ABC transporter ATP-binding protein [Verrucomicrobiales bacterium]|nr:ABC transporter ATP-binding protein [Verrucomicrobiales bacterium]
MAAVPAVRIEHLVKVFRLPTLRKREVRAVDDVSFTIAPGEVYGLIGPNGSGKSTTLKVLLGLLRATSGTAEIFGQDSLKTGSRDAVGYLPENPYFYKHLSGLETLQFYGKLCGLGCRALRERTAELLRLVRLEPAASRAVGSYSKGMLQRIGLAQALVQNPRMVVLDEPTAGVDPAGSRTIRDLILELKARGITVILTSHLLEQVQEVCDRIGIMSRGRMVRQGPLEELIALQDRQEIVLQGATPDLLEKIRLLVAQDARASLVHAGNSRTTLEHLYLEVTGAAEEEHPAAH